MYSSKRLMFGLIGLTALLTGCNEEEDTTDRFVPPTPPSGYYASPESQPDNTPAGSGTIVFTGSGNFPSYIAGNAPVKTEIALSNPSAFPVAITQIRYVGTSGIALVDDCAEILDAQSSCTVTLTGASLNPGTISGSLLILSDAGAFDKDITLTAAPPPIELPDSPTVFIEPPPAPPQAQAVAPPPIEPDYAAQRRSAILDYSRNRLQNRMAQGPQFTREPEQPIQVKPDPISYTVTDPNYLRENTPSETTSFPVDRTQILTMDRMAWGVLDREVNSQLPGLVKIIVDEPVYGTDGAHRLLERGDAILGRYEPLQDVGDTRLNVCFFRIIRLADGAHVYDQGDDCFAYAVDAMGRTGLVGDIDNRNLEKYGAAFVTAGISAIAQYGATTNAQQDPGLQGAGQSLNEQLGEITSKILEEQVDLAPIITVAAGERVGIQFLRDIYIRPPEPKSGQAPKGDQQ